MPGDTIGKMFRVTVWGESHGAAVGSVTEGCPPGIELDTERIREQLLRRRPSTSSYVSQRKENDSFEILSGLFEGRTTGAPISIVIKNRGLRKESYSETEKLYRPGHADFTYKAKYGTRDPYGGGRSSARLTAPIVAAGAIAEQVLKREFGTEIVAYVKKIGGIQSNSAPESVKKTDVRSSKVFFPGDATDVLRLLSKLRAVGNSIGGVVECVMRNVPAGLGEPLFDKLDGDLAKAMVGLNAAKGFEMGNGFHAAELTGLENNDEFVSKGKVILTKTNRAGGVLGGISNGMPLVFRVAFKATPSISIVQTTVDTAGKRKQVVVRGDHDVCVAIRAVPVVESLAAIVVCDHFLRYRGQCGVK